MRIKHLTYQIPGASWAMQFSEDVLSELDKYVQTGWSRRNESVGQLYAKDVTKDEIIISVATRSPSKFAYPTAVRLNLQEVKNERCQMFDKGYHCVGLWHTHPQAVPVPSMEDIALAKNHALASMDAFQGLLFLIRGTDPLPMGLGVWIHDGVSLIKAELLTPFE